MLSNIVIDGRLALGLLKEAINSGHLSLISPETDFEQEQVRSVGREIQRSRCGKTALFFALLADVVYIDGGNFGWQIFRNRADDNLDNLRSRLLLDHVSPEFEVFSKPVDSSSNYIFESIYELCPEEMAELFCQLEPLIWQSYRENYSPIKRVDEVAVLEHIKSHPHIISLQQSSVDSSEFDAGFADSLAVNPPSLLSNCDFNYVAALAYTTIIKGRVAICRVKEANKRKASLPIPGLTLFRSHRRSAPPSIVKAQDAMTGVRLFFDEIQHWPVVETLDDVIRIRQKREFIEFRENLMRWVSNLASGDLEDHNKHRREIRRAHRALARAVVCRKMGGIFTYLGLPMFIIDFLTGIPALGAAMTISGVGAQIGGDLWEGKNRWVVIGT
jgi:hypothetical protein